MASFGSILRGQNSCKSISLSRLLFHQLFGQDVWEVTVKRFSPVVHSALAGLDGPIVDAACGYHNHYISKLNLPNTIGIDIDNNIENKNSLHDNIIIQDLHNAIPLNNVSGIISVYTWEHLEDPYSVLRNFSNILSDQAPIIIIAPQRFYYLNLIILLLPHSVRNFLWRVFRGRDRMPYPAYYRLCSKRTLERAATAFGLDLVKYDTFDQPPHWFMRIPPLFVILCGWMWIANTFDLLSPVRSTFIAVLRKRKTIDRSSRTIAVQ